MVGRYEARTWQHDPTLYAPARYRRACAYDVFLPDLLVGSAPIVTGATAGAVSDAERALHQAGADAQGALAPLARLLLRTESIASSKVDGLQADARDLARDDRRTRPNRAELDRRQRLQPVRRGLRATSAGTGRAAAR